MSAVGFMDSVCAWCGCKLGVVPCVPELDGETTHGICPECVTVHFPDIFTAAGSDVGTSGALGVARGFAGGGDPFSSAAPIAPAASVKTDAPMPALDSLSMVSLDRVQANDRSGAVAK